MSALPSTIWHDYYSAYAVDPRLSRYIDCVWTERFSSSPEFRSRDHLIVPDNTVELVFTSHKIERRFGASSSDVTICKSHVAGLKTRPQFLKLTGEVLLSVRFKPYGLYRFVDIPLGETINESIPTPYLFGSDIIELEEKLMSSIGLEDKVSLINAYFTRKFNQSKNDKNELFDYLISRILETNGSVKINGLSKELNVSMKTIERRFQEYLGISPKQYCRLIRFFESLKHSYEPDSSNLSELAYRNGYYDQMHFVKEVKEFAGLTPSAYFGLDKGIQGPIFNCREKELTI